ncbi:9772_t:CDS:2, partial [Rhizophagus irregularis]
MKTYKNGVFHEEFNDLSTKFASRLDQGKHTEVTESSTTMANKCNNNDSYEKQIGGASSESALHYGIRCDCCNYTVRGMRWKCTTCEDYDLCQTCKTKSRIHHHPDDHVFKLIPHSDSSNYAPQFAVHYGIVCKYCDKTIHGMRWKCTFCEDCNLCQDCKSKSQSIHNHPNNHAFQPIAYSS